MRRGQDLNKHCEDLTGQETIGTNLTCIKSVEIRRVYSKCEVKQLKSLKQRLIDNLCYFHLVEIWSGRNVQIKIF